jgi:SAM-dependent methyltransferase
MTSRLFKGRSWTLAHCNLCAQHYTSPLPTDADIASFYAGDYHAPLREADGSERAFGEKYSRYVNTLSRFVPNGRVLDIGCATGLLVKRLIDRGYDALGIELNARSAEYGRRTFGIDIRNQPLEACAFEPQSFDGIFLTDVLEHTRSPLDFLREVHRILRPGGCAVITFPDIRSVESHYLKMLATLLRRDWIWNTCHIPLHTWEFTRPTASALFGSAGFEVAAFSRSQPPAESQPSNLLTLIHAPLRLLSLPIAHTVLGTQMEFVLRKVD